MVLAPSRSESATPCPRTAGATSVRINKAEGKKLLSFSAFIVFDSPFVLRFTRGVAVVGIVSSARVPELFAVMPTGKPEIYACLQGMLLYSFSLRATHGRR